MKTAITDPLEHTCGNCGIYDSDLCYCSLHGWHDIYEEDTCDDWREDVWGNEC